MRSRKRVTIKIVYEDLIFRTFDDGTATLIGTKMCFPKSKLNIPATIFSASGTQYSVTKVGDSALTGHRTIEKLHIPDSVTSIGSNAFNGCTRLKEIILPPSVKYVGSGAFTNCPELIKVDCSNTNLKIEKDEKESIVGIRLSIECLPQRRKVISPEKEINSECPLQKIEQGMLFDKQQEFQKEGFIYRVVAPEVLSVIGFNGLKEALSFAESFKDSHGRKFVVRHIEADALRGEKLKSVILSETIVSIGDNAFRDCDCLRTVTLSQSLKTIGDFAFANCRNMIACRLPSNITHIGKGCFKGCSKLTYVTIPPKLLEIGDEVFENCNSLKSVEGLRQRTSIGEKSFAGCNSLSMVKVERAIEKIATNAFESCDKLSENTLNILYGRPLQKPEVKNTGYLRTEKERYSARFKKGITKIKKEEFLGRKLLTDVVLPETVETIESFAFKDCQNLSKLALSNSLSTIEQGAFQHCSSLEEIDIPASVNFIGTEAFADCWRLKKIVLRSTYINMGDSVFRHISEKAIFVIVFDGTENEVDKDSFLKSLVPKKETSSTYNQNVAFKAKSYTNKPKSNTLAKPNKRSTDRDKVVSTFFNIGNIKFETVSGDSLVVAQNSDSPIAVFDAQSIRNSKTKYNVVRVSNNAFEGNRDLRIVVLPDTIKVIEKNVFKDCSNLCRVEIPNSITKIERNAFDGCTSLEEINIPDSVREIEEEAFANCSNLVTVRIPGTIKQIHRRTFVNCTNLNEVTFPDSLLVIHEDAFAACSSLVKVVIPRSVTEVKVGAFSKGCGVKVINVRNKKANLLIEKNAINGNAKITYMNVPKNDRLEIDSPNIEFDIARKLASPRRIKAVEIHEPVINNPVVPLPKKEPKLKLLWRMPVVPKVRKVYRKYSLNISLPANIGEMTLETKKNYPVKGRVVNKNVRTKKHRLILRFSHSKNSVEAQTSIKRKRPSFIVNGKLQVDFNYLPFFKV